MTYWNDRLLIGVPQIDSQHRKLIGAIDELMEACSKGQGRGAIEKTLHFAVSYAKEHFADEERLQAQVGYPGIGEHKKLHGQYISNITALVKEFEQTGPNVGLVVKVNQTFVDWLVKHISTEDQKIAAFIKSKNNTGKA